MTNPEQADASHSTDPPQAFRLLKAWVVHRLTATTSAQPLDDHVVVQGLSFTSQCLTKLAEQWTARVGQRNSTDVDTDAARVTAMTGAVAVFCTVIAGMAKVLAADLASGHDSVLQEAPVMVVDAVAEPIVQLIIACLSPTLHPADHATATLLLSHTLPTLDSLVALIITAGKRAPLSSDDDQLAAGLAHLLVQIPPLTLTSPLPPTATAHFWSPLWPTFTSYLCSRFTTDPVTLRDIITCALLPTLRSTACTDTDPRLAYPLAFWHSLSHLLPCAFPNPDSPRGHAHLPDPDSELAHRANVYLDLLDHLAALADHPRSPMLFPSTCIKAVLTCLAHLLALDALVELLVVNDAYGIATVRALTLVVTRHFALGARAGNEDEWLAFVEVVAPLMASSIPGLATVHNVIELAGLAGGGEGGEGVGGKVVLGKWAWLAAQLLHLDQAADGMVEWMMNGAQMQDDDQDGMQVDSVPDGLVIVEELLEVVDLLAPDVFGCPCCHRQAVPASANAAAASAAAETDGGSWVWDQTISALVAPVLVLVLSGVQVDKVVERWIRSLVRHLVKCRHTSTAQIVLACFSVMMEASNGQHGGRPSAVSEWIQSVALATKDCKANRVVAQRLEALLAVIETWGATGVGVL
ncbi:hypothetical protein BCR44DRAFT_70681 [Catenaria anguillulae PL171]|uniref:Uncharacterized protein n=1 Tax=Catenaria anguillulae PL171 TaxID=765915 RepID=A0A1Y2HWC2_9FUNG|nr:hypothetical protein BCR44DRAFT_70681 [Catenaria anguillulae PL171]